MRTAIEEEEEEGGSLTQSPALRPLGRQCRPCRGAGETMDIGAFVIGQGSGNSTVTVH